MCLFQRIARARVCVLLAAPRRLGLGGTALARAQCDTLRC
jgi:hypothetical protein